MLILLVAEIIDTTDCSENWTQNDDNSQSRTIENCVEHNISKLIGRFQETGIESVTSPIPDFLYLRNVTLLGDIDTSDALDLLKARNAIFCEKLFVEVNLTGTVGDYRATLFASRTLHIVNANFVFRYGNSANQYAINLASEQGIALYQNVSFNVFELISNPASRIAQQSETFQTVVFGGDLLFESVYLVHNGSQAVPTGVTSIVFADFNSTLKEEGESCFCKPIYELLCSDCTKLSLCYHQGANFIELGDDTKRPLLQNYYQTLISETCFYQRDCNQNITINGKIISSKQSNQAPQENCDQFTVQYLSGAAFEWVPVKYQNLSNSDCFKSLTDFERDCKKIGVFKTESGTELPFCACYGTLMAEGDCQCAEGFDEHCYACTAEFEEGSFSEDGSNRALSCNLKYKGETADCTIGATGHFTCDCAEGRATEFHRCVVQVNQRSLYIGLGCGIVVLLLICLVLGVLISMRQKGARQLVYQMQ